MTHNKTFTETSYGQSGCKIAVWNKAAIIYKRDPTKWRRDIYNNIIYFPHHGKSTKYGWDIDHYIPKAKGGSDNIENLHPVQSSKNRSMGMKMGDKNKRIWFSALEARAAKYIKTIEKCGKFKYTIGEQVLARQTPIAKTQLAIIKSIHKKEKKVQIYWIYGGYHETIEMYDKLFMKMSSCRGRIIRHKE